MKTVTLMSLQPWITSWLDLIGELEMYVQHYHVGGLKWNI